MQAKHREHLHLVVNNVIPLHKRRAADTIRALEKLLDQARDGHIKGFLWVAKYDVKQHQPGATGDYCTDLHSGIASAMALLDALHLHQPMPD